MTTKQFTKLHGIILFITPSYPVLQVLDELPHFIATYWLDTSVKATVSKQLHPSPNLSLMSPVFSVRQIRLKLIS